MNEHQRNLWDAMIQFQLCFLTASDHLADAIDLPMPSLEAAIEHAEGLADGRRMELWRDAERMKLWPAGRAEPAA